MSQSYAHAESTPSADDKVDAASRVQIVNSLADKMRDLYVFPDIGEQTAIALKKKLNDGGYDSVKYAVGLSTLLTTDVQAICNDLHLHVGYGETLPIDSDIDNSTQAEKDAFTRKQIEAFGSAFATVERLSGNIAYLDVHQFSPPNYSKQAIAVAMAQVADSAVLIVDLRNNHGGDPDTVALLSSYLFDKRTHLTDLYWRDGARTQQFWTDENVFGPKFGQLKPVFVLTSRRTFSAAEAFSYNLKILKRATIVGEATGGGANPGDIVRLKGNFSAFIPTGRAVNPITNTNWEGTGVTPDVFASYQTALLVAQKLAVQTLIAAEKDQQRLLELRGRSNELDAQLLSAKETAGK
ncbi:S41 family peptidase [Ideonella azotifigens]|uniref:S41 family peptidase n=2 Tax=Ideonella azotifigens TaxID=513160 RepID=A0ABP3VRU6_9BURK